MGRPHPYPKWLQWLLPYEDPQHPLHYSPDDESDEELMQQLADVLGQDFVNRIQNLGRQADP